MRTLEQILQDMQALVDGAEGRSLTDDEAERYEALEAELAGARRTAEIRARQTAYTTPVAPGAGGRGDLHVHTGVAEDSAEEREHAQAFDRYLRTGDQAIAAEYRAQSTTGSEGGFTVPQGFRQKLVDRIVAFGGIAQRAEQITTETGNLLPWPTLDDTGNEGSIAPEGDTGTGGADMVFGEKQLSAYRYTAPGGDGTPAGTAPLRVSVELLQDSAFDIQSLIVRKLGVRIARNQSKDWVNGTGTGQPLGLAGSAGPSFEYSGAAPTYDELVDGLHSVDPGYRAMQPAWTFNDKTLALIRKIVDGNGRPLWLPQQDSGMTMTPGGMLLGYPVQIDQAWPDYTDASGNTWGAFGDLQEAYVIRRVRSLQLVVDPYTRAANGQVAYTVWERADGTVQNDNAVALMTNDVV